MKEIEGLIFEHIWYIHLGRVLLRFDSYIHMYVNANEGRGTQAVAYLEFKFVSTRGTGLIGMASKNTVFATFVGLTKGFKAYNIHNIIMKQVFRRFWRIRGAYVLLGCLYRYPDLAIFMLTATVNDRQIKPIALIPCWACTCR
jgi:hypothetical protein